ncbi:hypothetical protein JZ751_016207 [Albula glossodonta]|uniref:Uncharacterized protein n=1 Tax=Albula glossodonta TaxID=121402 RepID=A0A8T2MR22_9TELE|nr:hypothetical protein JZ751_016207 [Albula glossodonta]
MEGHAPRGCGRNQVGGGGVRHRLLATLMWPRLSSSAGGGGGHARRNHSRRFAQRWAQDAIPELCGFHELAVKQTVRVRLQSPGWLCFITDVSSYSVERLTACSDLRLNSAGAGFFCVKKGLLGTADDLVRTLCDGPEHGLPQTLRGFEERSPCYKAVGVQTRSIFAAGGMTAASHPAMARPLRRSRFPLSLRVRRSLIPPLSPPAPCSAHLMTRPVRSPPATRVITQ